MIKRFEYLQRLERALIKVPENDRNIVMKHYIDRFDSEGSEGERKLIDELGAPEKLAYRIKHGTIIISEGEYIGTTIRKKEKQPEMDPKLKKLSELPKWAKMAFAIFVLAAGVAFFSAIFYIMVKLVSQLA